MSRILSIWRELLSFASRAALPAVAMLMAMIAGCGPTSDRLPISGRITLDGEPLDSGSIRFTSLEGQELLASGALIQNGQYQIPQEKGLRPGTYRVEMSSPDTKAPPVIVRAAPGDMGIPAAPERIPPAYNADSQQTVEVTTDGDNRFDFDIVNRSSK
ncbi:MAG: hypothetical protein L0Y58_25700 [Verrucomicrobia subdivision 3 bacterium]|nr:hypothetical protein [Limisphaerales bacterium]